MNGKTLMDTIEDILSTNEYYNHSRQDAWEKKSSIRTRPRRFISEEDIMGKENKYLFPLSRQPICVHPIIIGLGEKAKKYILIQSLYKFMMDIAILETEVVNAGALLVANNKLHFDFPYNLRHDAQSVIIDETYHAYVATDFMRQVELMTDVKPLSIPEKASILQAIESVKERIPHDYFNIFFLVAVCIGEHVLTKDLISVGKDETICKAFFEVMSDHVLDEGRHANIFSDIMSWVWEKMTDSERDVIGQSIPEFMKLYLKNEDARSFNYEILKGLKLSESTIDQIIEDTYVSACSPKLDSNNPVLKNLLIMLKRCRVLEHKNTNNAFEKAMN